MWCMRECWGACGLQGLHTAGVKLAGCSCHRRLLVAVVDHSPATPWHGTVSAVGAASLWHPKPAVTAAAAARVPVWLAGILPSVPLLHAVLSQAVLVGCGLHTAAPGACSNRQCLAPTRQQQHTEEGCRRMWVPCLFTFKAASCCSAAFCASSACCACAAASLSFACCCRASSCWVAASAASWTSNSRSSLRLFRQ